MYITVIPTLLLFHCLPYFPLISIFILVVIVVLYGLLVVSVLYYTVNPWQNAGEAKLDPISTDATLQQSGEGSKLKEKQGSCSGPGRGLRPQWGAELVALPEVNIRKNAPLKQLTIEDLPLIRKKVTSPRSMDTHENDLLYILMSNSVILSNTQTAN